MLRIQQGVLVGNIKLVKVNIMQEHVDTAKVICSQVDFLTIKALPHIFFTEYLRHFQKQRAGTAGGVRCPNKNDTM